MKFKLITFLCSFLSIFNMHSADFSLDKLVQGNIEEVEKFLKDGNDVNSEDAYGDTLLSRAVVNGRSDIVKMLILVGANVNSKDSRTNPLLNAAIFAPVYFAEEYDIIKLLLENGANPHIIDSISGMTLLHIAVYYSHEFIEDTIKLIELLLKYKVDPRLRDKKGMTGADYARKMPEYAKDTKVKALLQNAEKDFNLAEDEDEKKKKSAAQSIDEKKL